MVGWVTAVKKAEEALILSGVKSLPIDIDAIFQANNWELFGCTDVWYCTGRQDPFGIIRQGIDGKTYKMHGEFLTVYNENMLPQRIRWTKGHEAGHIILGHLDRAETACNCGVNAQRSRFLEIDANTCAAELLAPMALLKVFGVQSWLDIATLFGLSREASENRLKCYKDYRHHNAYDEYEFMLVRQFNYTIDCINDAAPEGAVRYL